MTYTLIKLSHPITRKHCLRFAWCSDCALAQISCYFFRHFKNPEIVGLPGVRFLTGQSGFGDLSGQKYDAKPDNYSCPVFGRHLNCTKFGQLILSKIIKIVAISCQISRMHQIRFWQTLLGELTALPQTP